MKREPRERTDTPEEQALVDGLRSLGLQRVDLFHVRCVDAFLAARAADVKDSRDRHNVLRRIDNDLHSSGLDALHEAARLEDGQRRAERRRRARASRVMTTGARDFVARIGRGTACEHEHFDRVDGRSLCSACGVECAHRYVVVATEVEVSVAAQDRPIYRSTLRCTQCGVDDVRVRFTEVDQ